MSDKNDRIEYYFVSRVLTSIDFSIIVLLQIPFLINLTAIVVVGWRATFNEDCFFTIDEIFI
jgi:hypothetical protein